MTLTRGLWTAHVSVSTQPWTFFQPAGQRHSKHRIHLAVHKPDSRLREVFAPDWRLSLSSVKCSTRRPVCHARAWEESHSSAYRYELHRELCPWLPPKLVDS